MTGLTAAAAQNRSARPTLVVIGTALALAAGCSSGPQPETSGVPGFEPTIQTHQLTPTDRYFSLDETLAGVERVTADDLQRVATDLFANGSLGVTVLGPKNGYALSRERLNLG